MAIVQTKSYGSSTTGLTHTLVLDSNTTTGNTVIISVATRVGASTVSSISDGIGGDTYSQVVANGAGAGSRSNAELWYCPNITGGTLPTITVTLSGVDSCSFIVREYSGLTATPLDKTVGTNGSSTTPSSGASASTTQNDEVVIGIGAGSTSGNTWTAGTGFANLVQKDASNAGNKAVVAMEDKTVSSTGTQTATFTINNSDSWQACVATFKISSVVTVPARKMTLLGVG